MSCGVETITAPASGTRCAMVSCAVAGARRQVDDQDVELAPRHVAQHLLEGPITIGPRQMIGCSSGSMKPIDIT